MRGVFQRGNNYYIDYRVNGRRKRETIGPSKKLAETVLRKRKVAAAENKHLDVLRDEKIRFKDFAQDFMEKYSKPNKRSWKSSDQTNLNKLTPFFGHKYLYEITPELVEQYKSERIKQVSPATVNRELACLKCMFSRAVDWNKARFNPVKKVKFFKENNQRVRYLEKEELVRLLEQSSPNLRAVIITAVNTGMRKSELQNLKWHDIDFQRNVIRIDQTKNGEPRYVPINKVVRDTLISVRKYLESSYVFCAKDGYPYDFRKSFETALKKSGIIAFRFHDLRHTFASHLAMSGVDLNTVRELLGHKDLKMTLRYSHLSPDHKSRAVEILSNKMDTFWTLGKKSTDSQDSDKIATSLSIAV